MHSKLWSVGRQGGRDTSKTHEKGTSFYSNLQNYIIIIIIVVIITNLDSDCVSSMVAARRHRRPNSSMRIVTLLR